MAVAVQHALELLVRTVVRRIVPVEAAATLGGTHEQRDQHAAIERATLVRCVALVCAREDARRGLALQIRDCFAHVVARVEPVGMRLDEAAHERPVLVQRRTAVVAVLLERERQVGAVERREGSKAEPAQRVVEMRRAHPPCLYAFGCLPPLWQPGHQYAIRAFSPCG